MAMFACSGIGFVVARAIVLPSTAYCCHICGSLLLVNVSWSVVVVLHDCFPVYLGGSLTLLGSVSIRPAVFTPFAIAFCMCIRLCCAALFSALRCGSCFCVRLGAIVLICVCVCVC